MWHWLRLKDLQCGATLWVHLSQKHLYNHHTRPANGKSFTFLYVFRPNCILFWVPFNLATVCPQEGLLHPPYPQTDDPWSPVHRCWGWGRWSSSGWHSWMRPGTMTCKTPARAETWQRSVLVAISLGFFQLCTLFILMKGLPVLLKGTKKVALRLSRNVCTCFYILGLFPVVCLFYSYKAIAKATIKYTK